MLNVEKFSVEEDSSIEYIRYKAFKRLIEKLSDTDIAISLKRDLIDVFIADQLLHGIPLVFENKAVFFYNKPASTVRIVGDLNGWNAQDPAYELTPVSHTNFFYLEKSFEPDGRFDYKMIIDGNWQLDPLNQRIIAGGFGKNSELCMPEYSDDHSYLLEESVPQGRLITLKDFPNKTQNGWKRQITIYLPAEYDHDSTRDKRYPSFYIADGSDYLKLGCAKNVLDFHIAKKTIPPLIGVFISPISPSWRIQEYHGTNCNLELDPVNNPGKKNICKQKYIEFLVSELVPYVDTNFRTYNDPHQRAHIGCSLGGQLSVFIALTHPDIFLLVGAQSGAFWIDPQTYTIFEQAKKRDNIRFYFNAGKYESKVNIEVQEFAKMLRNRHYEVCYEEYAQGHSWGLWRATLSKLLWYLFATTNNHKIT
jgi:enterochelin esterase-like enzyme